MHGIVVGVFLQCISVFHATVVRNSGTRLTLVCEICMSRFETFCTARGGRLRVESILVCRDAMNANQSHSKGLQYIVTTVLRIRKGQTLPTCGVFLSTTPTADGKARRLLLLGAIPPPTWCSVGDKTET